MPLSAGQCLEAQVFTTENTEFPQGNPCETLCPPCLGFALLFHYAATSRCDRNRDSVFPGCALSLRDRRGQASLARSNLADQRWPTHVRTGTRRTLHGDAGGKWLGT